MSWVDTPPGRGTQLQAGATAASARLLFFVHADARLDSETLAELERMAQHPPEKAVAFRLRIDSPRPIYRVLEHGTNFRGRFLGLPYGDQGLVVLADAYRAVGGYPSIPLMEDVALVRTLRRHVGVRLATASIRISPRRWERDGPLRPTFRNLLLLMRYLLGADPRRLARTYRANG